MMHGHGRFYHLALFAAFAALAAGMVAAYNDGFLPRHVFYRYLAGVSENDTPIAPGQPVTFEFDAPAAGIGFVQLPNPHEPVHATLWNLRSNTLVASARLTKGNGFRFDFPATNDAGDRMRMELAWDPGAPPVLATAPAPPRIPVRVTVGGAPSDLHPLFNLGFKDEAPQGYEPIHEETYPPPPGPDTVSLPLDQAVRSELEAPYANMDRIWLPHLLQTDGQKVFITVENVTRDKVLKESTDKAGKMTVTRFTGDNAPGDTLAVTLEWNRRQPRLRRQEEAPLIPVAVTVGGQPAPDGFSPSFMLGYERDGAPYFLWWLPALAALVLAARAGGRGTSAALLLTGAAAVATGWFCWQGLYSEFYPYTDPDGYRAYGEVLGSFLRGEVSRAEAADWIRAYPHAHIALTPAVIAVLTAVGAGARDSYLWLVAVAYFGAVLLLHRALVRHLGVSPAAALLGSALFAGAPLMVRMAGQPSTDTLGVCLVMAAMAPVLRRWKSGSARYDALLFGALITLNALARPPAITYSVFIAAAVVAADALRDRRWSWRALVLTPLQMAALPVAVLGALYLGFDWFHNFGLAVEKQKDQVEPRGALEFVQCLLVCSLPGAVLWPALAIRRWRPEPPRPVWPVAVLAMGFVAFFVVVGELVAMLHMPRLFAPIVPATALLTAVAAATVHRRAPMTTVAFVTVAVAAGAWLAVADDYFPVLPDFETGSIYQPVHRRFNLQDLDR